MRHCFVFEILPDGKCGETSFESHGLSPGWIHGTGLGLWKYIQWYPVVFLNLTHEIRGDVYGAVLTLPSKSVSKSSCRL